MKISEKHAPISRDEAKGAFLAAVSALEVGEAITLEWEEGMKSGKAYFAQNCHSRARQAGIRLGRKFKAMSLGVGKSQIERIE